MPAHRGSDQLWSPIVAAFLTVVPGLIAVATGQVLLFPSLGPTAVTQAHMPEQRSAHAYNVLVSHISGLISAYLAVWVFGIAHAPSVFDVHAVSLARVFASGLAILLAVGLELVLDASHPPAASTTLLVALGSFKPTWHDALEIIGGVVIVAILGEVLRRIRLVEETDAK